LKTQVTLRHAFEGKRQPNTAEPRLAEGHLIGMLATELERWGEWATWLRSIRRRFEVLIRVLRS